MSNRYLSISMSKMEFPITPNLIMLLTKFSISVNGFIICPVAQIKNWVILDHSTSFTHLIQSWLVSSIFKLYLEFYLFFFFSSATTSVYATVTSCPDYYNSFLTLLFVSTFVPEEGGDAGAEWGVEGREAHR